MQYIGNIISIPSNKCGTYLKMDLRVLRPILTTFWSAHIYVLKSFGRDCWLFDLVLIFKLLNFELLFYCTFKIASEVLRSIYVCWSYFKNSGWFLVSNSCDFIVILGADFILFCTRLLKFQPPRPESMVMQNATSLRLISSTRKSSRILFPLLTTVM